MGDREIEENRGVVNDEAEVRPHAVGFTSFGPRGETRGLEEGGEEGEDVVMPTSDRPATEKPAGEKMIMTKGLAAGAGRRRRSGEREEAKSKARSKTKLFVAKAEFRAGRNRRQPQRRSRLLETEEMSGRGLRAMKTEGREKEVVST